ncbi:MAG TPA: TonB-dependent receptor, partial [Flavobacterium sp.]|nr:TonB-dependent receptor [Flavobacterium sp.]
FSSIISNTKNKFSTSVSFTYDKFKEFVSVNFSKDFSRVDNAAGAFFEYNFDNLSNFQVVAGLRVDNHNRLGTFVTPRLHLRYNPWKDAVLRASAGRGKRAANIFAENQQLFASNRSFSILNNDGKLYGLNPEIAWNFGLSFIQNFKLFGKNSEIIIDYYKTDFKNQAVIDVDFSPQQVLFYNLKGTSVAHSFQLEYNIELKHRLNLKTAYKYYDVNTDFLVGNLQRSLLAKHRFFVNLAYETSVL